MIPSVPPSRLHPLNDRPVLPAGRYVLYWMVAARRTGWNYGLQRAAALAFERRLPLIVLEALRCDYLWASRRHHQAVVDGMIDNAAALAHGPVAYYPYLEPTPRAGRGLVEALAAGAAAVVTDVYPTFFLPRMQQALAARVACRVEAVDGLGLLPLTAAGRAFPTAHAFRRHLQRTLPDHLLEAPVADLVARLAPLAPAVIPSPILARWPAVPAAVLRREAPPWSWVDVPDSPAPTGWRGGAEAAQADLEAFVRDRLEAYGADRNHPDADGQSGLSFALHWGHLGAHQLFAEVAAREGVHPSELRGKATGAREGWWGMSPSAEGFLDEAITWRELGAVFCHYRPEDHDRFASLPDWARATLEAHAGDPRPEVYDLATLDRAATGDPLWNAAQNQLREEGRIHNYLRMLWGKKILQWTRSPQEALAVLTELNNRYALDGRDPNSWSGIFWTLGRFDRPWGPERPIFGTVRYMTSDSAARKLRLRAYLARWSG